MSRFLALVRRAAENLDSGTSALLSRDLDAGGMGGGVRGGGGMVGGGEGEIMLGGGGGREGSVGGGGGGGGSVSSATYDGESRSEVL